MATTRRAAQAASKGLEDLFLDGLKDLYYAEKKILKSPPENGKRGVRAGGKGRF